MGFEPTIFRTAVTEVDKEERINQLGYRDLIINSRLFVWYLILLICHSQKY